MTQPYSTTQPPLPPQSSYPDWLPKPPAPDLPLSRKMSVATLLQRVFGYILLIVGAYMVFFFLREIYDVYLNIDNNKFINTITQWITDQPLLLERGQEPAFILGKASAVIVSIFFFMLFAWMCASVAYGFIRAGIELLTKSSR